MDILKQFKEIAESSSWIEISKIEKGWSNDTKYYIKDDLNQEFVLRVADISRYDRKKEEYEVMKKFYSLDINMSKPLSFGVCNNKQLVYILVDWIKGEQAEIVLVNLSKEIQYELGYQAGMILRKTKNLEFVSNISDFEKYFNDKIDSRIEAYQNCSVKNSKVDEMVTYINDNRHLLKNRKQYLRHGDYHVGNMIIDEDNKLSIIDFNRFRYGDIIDEFNRISISSRISKEFVNAQINAFHNDDVPESFFIILKFYVLSTMIGTIPWSLIFDGDDDLKFAIECIDNVYDEYDKLKSIYPSWYINIKEN